MKAQRGYGLEEMNIWYIRSGWPPQHIEAGHQVLDDIFKCIFLNENM